MATHQKIALLVLFICAYVFWQAGPGPPGPGPDPAPIPQPGLFVMIVEETADRPNLTDDQLTIIQSAMLRDKVEQKGGQLRVFDVNVENAAEPWNTALARPRTETPWLLISNHPEGGYEGPLPERLEHVLELLP